MLQKTENLRALATENYLSYGISRNNATNSYIMSAYKRFVFRLVFLVIVSRFRVFSSTWSQT